MADQQRQVQTSTADAMPGDGPLPLRVLAEIIWQQSSRMRDTRHRECGRSRCPTRSIPYAHGLGAAEFRESCLRDGCADVVHDLLTRCLERLRGVPAGRVGDIERYANRLVANEVCEWERRERVARGGPAKPARTDGVPARVNSVLSEHADPGERDWLLALFRMIRAYPHRLEPHSGTWPLDGWTAEKSTLAGGIRVLGSGSARAEISRDIERVLAVAAAVAGPAWVHETIIEPMARRRPQQPLPDVSVPAQLEDVALAHLLVDDFRARRAAGAGPRSALAAATEKVLGCVPAAAAYGECLQLVAAVGGP